MKTTIKFYTFCGIISLITTSAFAQLITRSDLDADVWAGGPSYGENEKSDAGNPASVSTSFSVTYGGRPVSGGAAASAEYTISDSNFEESGSVSVDLNSSAWNDYAFAQAGLGGGDDHGWTITSDTDFRLTINASVASSTPTGNISLQKTGESGYIFAHFFSNSSSFYFDEPLTAGVYQIKTSFSYRLDSPDVTNRALSYSLSGTVSAVPEINETGCIIAISLFGLIFLRRLRQKAEQGAAANP